MTAPSPEPNNGPTNAPTPKPSDLPTQVMPAEVEPEATPEESPNAEAAKWRTRLRESEAREATLTGRIEAMQRAEVERLAADKLAMPSDLWAVAGADLATLVDAETCAVDAEAVTAAVADLLALRPGLALPPNHSRAWGQGARGPAPQPKTSWQAVLQG